MAGPTVCYEELRQCYMQRKKPTDDIQVTTSLNSASDTQQRIIEALQANTTLLEQLLAELGTEKNKANVAKVCCHVNDRVVSCPVLTSTSHPKQLNQIP
jgi:hypothetical protein